MILSLVGVKSQATALTAPDGTRGSDLLLLDERRGSSVFSREWRPADRAGGRGVTTGPLRSVKSLSCVNGADVAWCKWVSVLKDGAGPIDTVGVFQSAVRASGVKFLARGGSFSLAVLEERDEVAKLVGSSLMEKNDRAPAIIVRRRRMKSCERSRCKWVDFPTPQTNRRFTVRKKWRRTRSCMMATRRHRSLLAARRVPGGNVQGAGSYVMVQGGSVWGACLHCRG